MSGTVFLIMSMGSDETGFAVSCSMILLSIVFLFISLYSAKSREYMEKQNKLLEQIYSALNPSHPTTEGEVKETVEGAEDATDFSASMKKDINKYKEMYENGQITKEVYTELLENQSSKLG